MGAGLEFKEIIETIRTQEGYNFRLGAWLFLYAIYELSHKMNDLYKAVRWEN